jgi:hypothetical protein
LSGFVRKPLAPVARVEVSTDGGASWADAMLEPPVAPYAWRHWGFDWDAAEGEYILASRATDRAGNTQPLHQRWNAKGVANNMVQTVSVHVRPDVLFGLSRPSGEREPPTAGRHDQLSDAADSSELDDGRPGQVELRPRSSLAYDLRVQAGRRVRSRPQTRYPSRRILPCRFVRPTRRPSTWGHFFGFCPVRTTDETAHRREIGEEGMSPSGLLSTPAESLTVSVGERCQVFQAASTVSQFRSPPLLPLGYRADEDQPRRANSAPFDASRCRRSLPVGKHRGLQVHHLPGNVVRGPVRRLAAHPVPVEGQG